MFFQRGCRPPGVAVDPLSHTPSILQHLIIHPPNDENPISFCPSFSVIQLSLFPLGLLLFILLYCGFTLHLGLSLSFSQPLLPVALGYEYMSGDVHALWLGERQPQKCIHWDVLPSTSRQNMK